MQVQTQHVAGSVLPRDTLRHDGARDIASSRHRRVLRRLAVVNFIAVHLDARQRGPLSRQRLETRLATPDCLVGLEHRDQWQQAQSRRIAVDAVRIDQRLAQHLQATAHAQHSTASCSMGGNGPIEPLQSQPGQIAAGVLGARQHDGVTLVQRCQFGRAAHPQQAQARHVFQRLELVEVADARIGDDRHGPALVAVGSRPARRRRVEHAIFLGQTVPPPHRQGRDSRYTGQRFELLGRGRQQRGVTAKLVEHEAVQQGAIRFGHQRPGTVQVRKGTTPVDVRDQQAARVGMPRDAKVDDVAGHQVDLGRRARAFDHDHVVFLAQRIERLRDLRPHALAAVAPWKRREFCIDPPHQHHLAVRVALGLQEQGVVTHFRLGARGERLEVLGAADFATPIKACKACHDTGIVAHVLRLERRHLEALAGIPTAQGRREPALAGTAGGAEDHDAAGSHFNTSR